jgi:hypothetical protein
MGTAADNRIKAEALADDEVELCDGCKREYERKYVRSCRKCGEMLCEFCMDTHDCDDEYGAKPKKGLDKKR